MSSIRFQLHSKRFKNEMGLRNISISHNGFTYNWPPCWTPSWIYRNAQYDATVHNQLYQGISVSDTPCPLTGPKPKLDTFLEFLI